MGYWVWDFCIQNVNKVISKVVMEFFFLNQLIFITLNVISIGYPYSSRHSIHFKQYIYFPEKYILNLTNQARPEIKFSSCVYSPAPKVERCGSLNFFNKHWTQVLSSFEGKNRSYRNPFHSVFPSLVRYIKFICMSLSH